MMLLRDRVKEWYYRILASCWGLRRLLGPPVPKAGGEARPAGSLQLEIVSHCWQYASLLNYQLSSLVLYPPSQLGVTMTVLYSRADQGTCRVLDFFSRFQPPNVRWNWRELEPEQLFRRAIGRNMAAMETTADWIWFTDCDQVFHRGCLDALASALRQHREPLVYPRIVHRSPHLPDDSPVLSWDAVEPRLAEIDMSMFYPHPHLRAIGPVQIVRGDVARQWGYCRDIAYYMKPCTRWRKTYEDRMFRWILGTQGTPIDVPGLYRIEHQRKGRKCRLPMTVA